MKRVSDISELNIHEGGRASIPGRWLPGWWCVRFQIHAGLRSDRVFAAPARCAQATCLGWQGLSMSQAHGFVDPSAMWT